MKTTMFTLICSVLFTLFIFPELINIYHNFSIFGVFLVWSFIFCSILFLVHLFLKKQLYVPAPIWKTAFSLYTVSLLFLLFNRPQQSRIDPINLEPFQTISLYLHANIAPFWIVTNLLANVALFVPFGIWFKIRKTNFFYALFLSILTIFMIESLQLLFSVGSFDIDDIMLNMAGITIGLLIAPIFLHVIKFK